MHSNSPGLIFRLSHLTIDQRLLLVRKAICLFLLIGIILSFRLWQADRFFPLTPFIEGLNESSTQLNSFLLIVLALSLVSVVLTNKVIFLRIALCALIIILLQDQQRWQPWVYFYLLVLLPFAIDAYTKQPISILVCIQIVIVGIYLWSGIHKFNSNFIDLTFTNILTNFFQIKNERIISVARYGGYLVSILEVLIAVALTIPKFRTVGVILVISLHTFILVYLSPLGVDDNSIVYPWNIAMMLLTVLLFYKQKNDVTAIIQGTIQMKLLSAALMVLVLILPFLNFANKWDSYLSFSLYSDKISLHYVAIEKTQLDKIDVRLHKYFVNINGLSGGEIIDINKWSTGELNVPFYPETRVFRDVCKSFCKLGIEPGKIYFLEFQQPLRNQKFQRYTCDDLN
jgi:uncharacterized membrane protein YphA (DoxX/SURF4 family)